MKILGSLRAVRKLMDLPQADSTFLIYDQIKAQTQHSKSLKSQSHKPNPMKLSLLLLLGTRKTKCQGQRQRNRLSLLKPQSNTYHSQVHLSYQNNLGHSCKQTLVEDIVHYWHIGTHFLDKEELWLEMINNGLHIKFFTILFIKESFWIKHG